MSRSARTLRLALLASLGLGASCECSEWVFTAAVDLKVLSELGYPRATECPTDLETVDAMLGAEGDPCLPSGETHLGVVEAQLDGQVGSVCNYTYVCTTYCCGYGRPFLDEAGAAVLAPTRRASGWAEGPRPDVCGLTAEQRETLGVWWTKNAQAEHSSIAGFHRFALELLAHGAPPELLAGAQRGAMQELRHARDCFALASAYLGSPVAPGPMELGGRAAIARDIVELAVWTARDGAIGETLAAHLAAQAHARATDPAVRAVLATIVREETAHAELAWQTLRWAIAVGGEPVRTAVREVFATLADPRPHDLAWSPGLDAHGLSSPEQEAVDAGVAIAEVIRPVAAALLAARAA